MSQKTPQEQTGPEQTGPEQTGPEQTGPEQTGPEQTGPEQTGPEQTGPEQTGPEQTGPRRSLRLEDVERILAENKAELMAQGVKSLAVFGSVARGDSGPGSDVDLLVEFNRSIGMFHFFHVQELLRDMLGGVEVDLVTRDAVFEALKEEIYNEAINVI
jgi:predicted nucleotidyltransferase